jgi:antirestriction protein ArdC
VGLPLSLSSRKPYRGVNVFLLGFQAQVAGYSSPWWGTYDQLAERAGGVKINDGSRKGFHWEYPNNPDGKGGVRKGEKSTLVIFWKRTEYWATDENTGERARRQAMMLRYFNVFNAEQGDHVKVPKLGEVDHGDPIAEAEAIVSGYFDRVGAPGRCIDNAAWYSPRGDMVGMPPREAFRSQEEYYSTLFHEMTHSTGAKHRLKRDGIVEGHRFGDELYSKEELIAEMGAAMLAGTAGIEQTTMANSAAYIRHWIDVLRGDAKLAVQAAGAAQRACDFIQGISWAEKSDDDDGDAGVAAKAA